MRVEQPRRLVGPGVMSLGAVVAVGASFAGWLRTGAVERSSYQILGLVERLGFAPDGPIRTLVRAWPLMPLLMAGAVVTAWWGQRLLGASLGIVAGLYAGVLGGAIAAAVPERHLVAVSDAPVITAAGAAVVIAGSLLSITLHPRHGGTPQQPGAGEYLHQVNQTTASGAPGPRAAHPADRS